MSEGTAPFEPIKFNEFSTAWKRALTVMLKIFDANGDGVIDTEDILKIDVKLIELAKAIYNFTCIITKQV
jgi:hypothetical protein